MASPSVPNVSFDLSGHYQGIYSASYISAMLLGISIAQTYMYFRNYPKDRVSLKLFVVWLLALNIAAQILVIKGLSRPLFNPNAIGTILTELVWGILTTNLLSSSAQIFFTYRLWIYSDKNMLYPLILIPAALSQLVAGIIYINGATRSSAHTSLHGIDFERAALAANSIAVGVDITITTLMGYRLLTSRTGFAKTDRIINTLFIITVNSGLWTAIVAVVALAASIRFSNLLNYSAIYVMLPPLYCNTVLANLNVRDYVRSQGQVEMDTVASRFKTVWHRTDGAPIKSGSMPQFAVLSTSAPSSDMAALTVANDSRVDPSKENLYDLKTPAIPRENAC